MTEPQKVALRQSQVRSRLLELGALADQTAETRAEVSTLTTEMGTLETRAQALIVGGETVTETETETGTAADPKLRALIERASVGDVVSAVLEQRHTDGATREVQTEYGLAGNQVPLALLAGLETAGPVEHRTTGVTPAPTDVGASAAPIIPAVFPMAVAAFLGIPQPRVPVGERVYTVLSTSAAPGTPAKGAEEAHSIGAFTPYVLSPKRIQASMFFQIEDRARLAGLGEALRMNLSDALADKLDDEILTGTEGLFTGTKLPNNNAAAADDFGTYRTRFVFTRVDGKYAASADDLRLVVGSDTYADMAATYRGNNSDVDAMSSISAALGGRIRVSAHVPATASSKQNGVVRRGMRQDMTAPIWDGITLIEDNLTQAQAGEIILTAVMLHAVKILRKDGFAKVQAQHS